MEAKDIDELLFRASSMGDTMSGVKKGWTVEQSVTCKRKLVQMYRERLWKRRSFKTNKYTEKGTNQEDESIDLYCIVKRKMFKKNVERLTNNYFTGELDLFEGETIKTATRTIDIKTCWDWTTFPSIVDNKPDDDYEYQGYVYNDLTGATSHIVAKCLVNTPADLITNEKRILAYKMHEIQGGEESAEYIKACIEIEKNSIVDMGKFLNDYPWFEFHIRNWDFDIPAIERVHEIEIKRDILKLTQMKQRVIDCRAWMKTNLL